MRRNLQREHLPQARLDGRRRPIEPFRRFARVHVLLGSSSVPADARALARLHLKEIDGRIGKVLARKDVQVDDTTRADLEECHNQIEKVLDASMTLNAP